MISIDIGSVNLGYVVLDADGELDIGLFELSERGSGSKNNHSLILKRCDRLYELLEPIINEKNIETLVIERQVLNNHVATSLMHCVIGMVRGLGVKKIIIFNPKKKFIKLRIPYETKNKAHKKLSVEIAEELIKWKFPEMYNEFTKYKKKDDMADALLQLFVSSGIAR